MNKSNPPDLNLQVKNLIDELPIGKEIITYGDYLIDPKTGDLIP